MTILSRLTAAAHNHSLRHLSPISTQQYHTPATSTAVNQPQLDYDLYNSDDNNDTITPPLPAVDSNNCPSCRGVQWVFIGNPDTNKHLYAHMISKLLHVPLISISSLLRQDLNPNSPLYIQIAESINHKKIVPETIIFGLLSKRLEDGRYRGETGFILDGIPRTRLQAEILDQFVDIDLVVNFKRCGDHFQAGRTTAEEAKPNVTTFYREQKIMLEEYYQNQKKLIDFQVGNAPGETWKGLLAALHLQHTNAAQSSWRLAMGFTVP